MRLMEIDVHYRNPERTVKEIDVHYRTLKGVRGRLMFTIGTARTEERTVREGD